jgi:2-C-methyl-D-erythritol 4-phosphate cytidylyltransferase
MRTVAVVLAGGTGSRFGSSLPKQLQVLGGATLLARCVETFGRAPGVDDVLVVTAAELAGPVRDQLAGSARLADVIEGGVARTDSTQRAIAWLTSRAAATERGHRRAATERGQHRAATERGQHRAATERGQHRAATEPRQNWKVLFHDAARPLVDQKIIADCIAALDRWDAVGVVVPSPDTIVQLAEGAFGRILPRDSLARCQTPQGFRLSVISRAYELAAADPGFAESAATDDCGVVLRYLPDVPVGTVLGSERNLKITYPADLAIARALLDLEPDGRPLPG